MAGFRGPSKLMEIHSNLLKLVCFPGGGLVMSVCSFLR